MIGPALRTIGRQAARIRRQDAELVRLSRGYRMAVAANHRLAQQLAEARADAVFFAGLMPADKRRNAREFIDTLHDVTSLPETTEGAS